MLDGAEVTALPFGTEGPFRPSRGRPSRAALQRFCNSMVLAPTAFSHRGSEFLSVSLLLKHRLGYVRTCLGVALVERLHMSGGLQPQTSYCYTAPATR